MLDQMANHIENVLALTVLRRSQALADEALCWAALSGRVADVRWLLEHGGASAESKDPEGDPAIVLAAAHGEEASLRLLLDFDANTVRVERFAHPGPSHSRSESPFSPCVLRRRAFSDRRRATTTAPPPSYWRASTATWAA